MFSPTIRATASRKLQCVDAHVQRLRGKLSGPMIRHSALVRQGKDYGKPRMTYKDYTMTESGLQYQVRWGGAGAHGSM